MPVTLTDLLDTTNLLRHRAHSLRMMAHGIGSFDKEHGDALHVAISDLENEIAVLKDGLEALEVVS